VAETSSLSPDDPAEPCAMIAALEAESAAMRAETTRLTVVLKAHEAVVQALQIRTAKLQRQKFGPRSHKIVREIEQLELALEALKVAGAADREREEEPKAEPEVAEPAPMRRNRGRIVLDPWGPEQADKYLGQTEDCLDAICDRRVRSRSCQRLPHAACVHRCQHHYIS
jgi:hypothetical protein